MNKQKCKSGSMNHVIINSLAVNWGLADTVYCTWMVTNISLVQMTGLPDNFCLVTFKNSGAQMPSKLVLW